MKKFFVLVAVVLSGFCASASSNVLEGQLVRQTLLTDDVKALIAADNEGQSLPLRIVYQSEAINTFQVFDPTQENLVIVNDVKLEVVDGALMATVHINVNGKLMVSKVYTKEGVKSPWNLSAI